MYKYNSDHLIFLLLKKIVGFAFVEILDTSFPLSVFKREFDFRFRGTRSNVLKLVKDMKIIAKIFLHLMRIRNESFEKFFGQSVFKFDCWRHSHNCIFPELRNAFLKKQRCFYLFLG